MHVYAFDLKTDKAQRINGVESVSECIKLCKMEPDCKAFSYATKYAKNSYIRKACWLKLGYLIAKEQSKPDPEIVSGLVPCTKHPDMPQNAIKYESPQI